MDDKDCFLLKAINEEHNITKAAKRLYISQPAVTYRLKNLEKEFGVKIVTRYSNGSFFTPQGEHILKHAEEMLERLQLTKTYVQSMDTHVQGTLRLGVSTVFAQFKIAPILKKYHENFPDVEIILKTGSSTFQLPDALQKNDIDIAILRGEFDWLEKKHIIIEEPLCMIAAHPIELSQLPSIPWIQYESARTTKSIDLLYNWWQDQFSAAPHSTIEVNSIQSCIQLVSHGLGWAIVPQIHISKQRSLFARPLFWRTGSPILQKTLMVYRTDSLGQLPIKMFVDCILNECLN